MKKFNTCNLIIIIIILGVTISGCATTARKAFEVSDSQVKLRSIQTRAFDSTDKKLMMQTVISTMQDLDFVIDKSDFMLGNVTGSKFLGKKVVTMSVTVRPRGEKQLLVRASAQCGIYAVVDPETYQDFFNVLGKSLFLTAQQVD